MKIEKELVVTLKATNGMEVNVGDDIAMIMSNTQMLVVGTYLGLTKRGALIVENQLNGVESHVMPQAIETLYIVKEFELLEKEN